MLAAFDLLFLCCRYFLDFTSCNFTRLTSISEGIFCQSFVDPFKEIFKVSSSLKWSDDYFWFSLKISQCRVPDSRSTPQTSPMHKACAKLVLTTPPFHQALSLDRASHHHCRPVVVTEMETRWVCYAADRPHSKSKYRCCCIVFLRSREKHRYSVCERHISLTLFFCNLPVLLKNVVHRHYSSTLNADSVHVKNKIWHLQCLFMVLWLPKSRKC